jgi:hypothetical protein
LLEISTVFRNLKPSGECHNIPENVIVFQGF